MYLNYKEREWMIVVVCEERETIKKIKLNWYYNKIKYKIDNMIWGVLKCEYVIARCPVSYPRMRIDNLMQIF